MYATVHFLNVYRSGLLVQVAIGSTVHAVVNNTIYPTQALVIISEMQSV